MNPTLEEILIEYAKTIQAYCKRMKCRQCVFYQSVNCRFVSGDTPYGWDFDDQEEGEETE